VNLLLHHTAPDCTGSGTDSNARSCASPPTAHRGASEGVGSDEQYVAVARCRSRRRRHAIAIVVPVLVAIINHSWPHRAPSTCALFVKAEDTFTMQQPSFRINMKTAIFLVTAFSCLAVILAQSITVATYSDATCTNVASSASIQSGSCQAAGTSSSSKATCSGSSITLAVYQAADCAGTATTTTIPSGQCIAGGSTSTKITCSSGTSVTLGLLSVAVAVLSCL
jgi:hypothetical protein